MHLHGINHARPSPQNQCIACHLCGKVFMSTQSLVNHIESHIIQEDRFSRTRTEWGIPPIRRDTIPSPRLSAFPSPLTSRAGAPVHGGFQPVASLGRNSNSVNGSRVAAPPSNPPQRMLPPVNWGNRAFRSQVLPPVGPQISIINESPNDFTRPYIQQLEHPISATIRPREADSEMDSGVVDLTLKL